MTPHRPSALAPGGVLFTAASAAALAAVTHRDPHALKGAAWDRHLQTVAGLSGVYVGAIAPAVASAVAAARGRLLSFPARLALGTGVGVATAALTWATRGFYNRVDGTAVRWLENLGVSNPRAVLAGISAAFVVVDQWQIRREMRTQHDFGFVGDGMEPFGPEGEITELPPQVRVLLETLLDPALREGAPLPGAAQLEQQLAHVGAWEDSLDGATVNASWLDLVFPDSASEQPRAVPHAFTWPVRGRFTREDREYVLQLQIEEGLLRSLAISPADEGDDDAWEAIEQEAAWPTPSELRFDVESGAVR
ncbi:MAG: hypothetical protein Q4G34_08350 [Micrococcus sp.]|nr:hypothetical protein [Micrococcus sp.]